MVASQAAVHLCNGPAASPAPLAGGAKFPLKFPLSLAAESAFGSPFFSSSLPQGLLFDPLRRVFSFFFWSPSERVVAADAHAAGNVGRTVAIQLQCDFKCTLRLKAQFSSTCLAGSGFAVTTLELAGEFL